MKHRVGRVAAAGRGGRPTAGLLPVAAAIDAGAANDAPEYNKLQRKRYLPPPSSSSALPLPLLSPVGHISFLCGQAKPQERGGGGGGGF